MILKQSVASTVSILAFKFGLEEVENELAMDKYRATEDGDIEAGVIGTVYSFKLEVLTNTLAVSESLTFGCDSFAVELAKAGFATTFTRTENVNDAGEKYGYLITYNCKTFI